MKAIGLRTPCPMGQLREGLSFCFYFLIKSCDQVLHISSNVIPLLAGLELGKTMYLTPVFLEKFLLNKDSDFNSLKLIIFKCLCLEIKYTFGFPKV